MEKCKLSVLMMSVSLFCVIGLPYSVAQTQKNPGAMSAEQRANHIRVNRELTWTMLENLITLGEYGVAESVLNEHLRVDPKDGRSWLFLQQIQLRQGKTEEARKSLAKGKKFVGNEEERMTRYSEAEYLYASGKRDAAIHEFKKLAEKNDPIGNKAQKVLSGLEEARNSGRKVASIAYIPGLIEAKVVKEPRMFAETKKEISENQKPSMPWSFNTNASLLSGYDANILQISDSVAPSASNLGSLFTSFGLQGVVSGGLLGGVLSVSGSGGYTLNSNELASGLNNITAAGGLQWGPTPSAGSNFAWTIGGNVASTFMESGDYGLYFLNYTVQPTLSYRISSVLNADLSASYGINKYPGVVVESDRDSRGGYQYGGIFGLRSVLGETSLGSSLSYTKQVSTGENFKTNGLAVSANAGNPIRFLNSSVSANMGWSSVKYPTSDTGRADNIYSAGMGWEVPVQMWSQKFKTTSSFGWSHVDSTDDAAKFTKLFFNLQLVYAIK